MIDHQDSVGTVSNILFSDSFDLMSQEDRSDPSLSAAKGSGLPQYFECQTVMGMIAMVSKQPDL